MSPSAGPGRRVVGLTVLTALLVVLTGCASLPTSGPVQREPVVRSGESSDAPYFSPPGPAEDGSPAEIVSGFLTAQQANPLSTRVAREFLSERTRSTWQPSAGTLIYEAFTVLPSAAGVRLRLSDVRRLDTRGGWRGGSPGEVEDIEVELVSEEGQWRIDNPPSDLIVPASFFDRAFERTHLFFYDQTGSVLLPDTVFVPRGDQTATDLVRGLLAGPGESLRAVTRSAFPEGIELELAVVVTESGVAEVPLTAGLLRAPAAELRRAADQLVRTLGQVPGIDRVRMSVDGVPVPLPGGPVDAVVTRDPALEASGPADASLLAVRQDRYVVLDQGNGSDQVAEGLSEEPVSARSFAVGDSLDRLFAVSADGTSLTRSWSTPGEAGTDPQAVLSGTDLARPSVDRFGVAWVLDRRDDGARVWLVQEGGERALDVPGVTGTDVSSLTVAPDGSRLVAGSAGSVRVVDVLRSDEGAVTGAGASRELALPAADGQVVDVGWRDPSVVAVLRTGGETSVVDLLSVDGAPLGRDAVQPSVLRGTATALVTSPSVGTPLRLLTADGDLRTLSAQGTWPRTASRVTAAAYLL